MTTLGRYHEGPLADATALDLAHNALPGVDRGVWRAQNIPAWACTSDLAATATDVAIGTRIFLRQGDIVTGVTFVSGATAQAAGATHMAFALYDPDGNLLSQATDLAAASAWAANSAVRMALGAPQTIAVDGWYIAANTVTSAGAIQTLIGCAPIVTASGNVTAASLDMGFTFGAALGGVFPATTGALTPVAKCPIVVLD